MPYKDPEKRKAVQRESQRRRRERLAKAATLGAESPAGVLPDPPDRETVLKLLGMQARAGHVTAMKTLLEEYRRVDDSSTIAADPLCSFDELAERRSSRAG